MADWAKKINKALGDRLEAGEVVRVGVLLQPAGFTRTAVAKGVGGMVGVAIANRMARDDGEPAPAGRATSLPEDTVILGLTDRRVVVCGWAKLTGKPKELLDALRFEELVGMDLTKQATGHAVVLRFADGSQRSFEAPRMGNQAEEFGRAVTEALATR